MATAAPRPRGFTLLELLVAVAVFATVGVLAIGGLRAVLDADQATRIQSERLAELQVTLAVLERDLRHSIALRPRDSHGDRIPALRYSPVTEPEQLELVRAGQGGHTRVGRVAWRITERGLERVTWPVLDGALPESEQSRLFLGRVQAPDARGGSRDSRRTDALRVRFEFVDGRSAEVHDSWPPLGAEARDRTPALVVVTLDLPGIGPIQRRIPTTGP